VGLFSFGLLLYQDVLVMDEAHIMLKNNKSKVFQVLSKVKTPRKIALTGSPFQKYVF
jgi:SNF2 family DNA or RNA helicase